MVDLADDGILAPDATVDLDAAPDQAVPDAAPVDQGPDADEPDAAPPHLDGLSLGLHPVDTPIHFTLPDDVDAVLIQARGAPDGLYGVVDVLGPPGRLVDAAGRAPNRTTLNPGVATALLPNDGDPSWALRAGDYQFTLVSARPAAGQLDVEVWFKRGGGGVRVNVWLGPDSGWHPDDASVALFRAHLARRLEADFDAVPAEVRVDHLTAGAPSSLEFDGLRQDFAGLAALAAHRPDARPGLDLYLVDQVLDGANRINGFSGGLPAPFGWPDTAAAVTAVRTPLLEDFPDAVAEMAAHELGHALGLYHTTEAIGGTHDPIADTPECPARCDGDGDGVLLASECGARGMGLDPCRGAADNRMFWTLGGARAMTDGQRRVVRGHPAVGSLD